MITGVLRWAQRELKFCEEQKGKCYSHETILLACTARSEVHIQPPSSQSCKTKQIYSGLKHILCMLLGCLLIGCGNSCTQWDCQLKVNTLPQEQWPSKRGVVIRSHLNWKRLLLYFTWMLLTTFPSILNSSTIAQCLEKSSIDLWIQLWQLMAFSTVISH